MKTLDERIQFVYDNLAEQEYSEGIYQYQLKRNNTIIFVGNFYYNGQDDAITFDMTEIIQSDGYSVKEDDFVLDDFTSPYTKSNKLLDNYYMEVVWDPNESPETSPLERVAKIYRYPNKNLDPSFPYFVPGYEENRTTVLVQGFRDSQSPVLVPHYPLTTSETGTCICPFAMSFLLGSDVNNVPTVFQTSGYARSLVINKNTNNFTYFSNVQTIAYYTGIVATEDGTLKVGATISAGTYLVQVTRGIYTYIYARYPQGDESTDYPFPYCFVLVNNSQNKSVTDTSVDYTNINTNGKMYARMAQPTTAEYVYDDYDSTPDVQYYSIYNTRLADAGKVVGGTVQAIFDVCPKRYYLFWQDRYGSFQCQSFNDKTQFSETFDRTEVQDYQNRRSNATIQVQPRWRLESGWIAEELYPYYESIFTSQILFLYDSEQNKNFRVLVSGDYEEKTYKNQKRLINLSLELEQNKTQRLIY